MHSRIKMSLFNNHALTRFLPTCLFVFAMGSLSIIISAAPTYNANYCPNNATYESNTIFQTNLRVLLYSLNTNATAGASTYESSMGLGSVNVASGLFLCRADVSSATCQDCVATAAAEITSRCPNKTESIIWYDECMLRYTNRYFSPVTVSPGVSLPADKNITASEVDSFNRTLFGLLDDLGEQTANSQSAKKFAAGEAQFGGSSSRVYAMTQCLPDLTTPQCDACLEGAIGTLPACCSGNQGARALLSSCNVRYELYRFYNISDTSPPSSELGHNPSWAWRSILEGRKVLEKGLLWKVGNGNSIRVFQDPWLPKEYPFTVPTGNLPNPTVHLVHNLLSDSGEWNHELIHRTFSANVAVKIFAVCPSNSKDSLY